ncbi:hypothetical protein LTR36_008385 [Oleoguttula mirabilis]|uniref:RING-type domain-containing protein n=1 Tax=Oleoguttula mirabilis TaxID=1507867 RepID=A0AAV9J7I9_9PEZI|nr:hypothetical protein LTR36_008385 [Oleoguttula mirabilis]
MSAEWLDAGQQQQQQQQDDAHRGVWQEADAEWGFDEVPADWSVWDEPPGVDRGLNDFDPYYGQSSSTVGDDFTPPRLSRDLDNRLEQDSQTHNHLGSTSLAHMGNTASASTNRPPYTEHTTSQHAHAQQPATSRHRTPVADHSDDWLGRSTRGGQTSFGYIPDHLFETLSESPESEQTPHSLPQNPIDPQSEPAMPPTTRRRARGSVVDLTTVPSSPQQPAPRAPKSLKRTAQDAEEGRSTKRVKRSLQHIDEVDMTEEAPSAEDELRQAQQEKAVAVQQAEQENSGPLKIGQRQCIICMENYTNATVTHCGHIYCHECLTQALRAGEKSSDRGVGTCPVCRKPVSRKKGNQMIPVAFMKKSAFKGKARKDMGLLG